ncbi:MAG: sodium-independent anion transporter [Actinomycetota bacterium]
MNLDSSGEAALAEVAVDYAARGVRLSLAEVKGPVLDVLRPSGFYEQLGPERFTFTDDEAVRRAQAWTLEQPVLEVRLAAVAPVGRSAA